MTKEQTWAVGLVIVVVVVVVFISRTQDPLKGRTADLMAYQSEEKTLCEGTAQSLQEKGVNGEAEYRKPEAAASALVGYLQGVLDQGNGKDGEIQERIERLRAASLEFRTWADTQLGGGKYGKAEKELDPIAMAVNFLKSLGTQEKERRRAVKESLEKLKFKSWADLAAGR